jgi:hypothetical protein
MFLLLGIGCRSVRPEPVEGQSLVTSDRANGFVADSLIASLGTVRLCPSTSSGRTVLLSGSVKHVKFLNGGSLAKISRLYRARTALGQAQVVFCWKFGRAGRKNQRLAFVQPATHVRKLSADQFARRRRYACFPCRLSAKPKLSTAVQLCWRAKVRRSLGRFLSDTTQTSLQIRLIVSE